MLKIFTQKTFNIFLSLIFIFPLVVFIVNAQEEDTKNNSNVSDLQNKIEELEKKLSDAKDQEKTLKNEITKVDNQISVTNYKIQSSINQIDEKQREITFLKQDISFLEDRLVKIKESILQYEKLVDLRIREKYKSSRGSGGGLSILLADANGFASFISRLKYSKVAEDRDKNLLGEMKSAENSYESQQGVLQDKKDEVEKVKVQIEVEKTKLEGLKGTLDVYKQEKNTLLEVTKNDEVEYKRQLDQAKAELEAIQNIVSSVNFSNGSKIKKGTPIAVMGNSGYPNCSTAAHLHFEVRKNGVVTSPLNYLKSKSVYVYDFSNGEKNLGSGKWSWPMEGMQITQMYGKTPWSWRYASGRHDGIDMVSSNTAIYAPEDGVIVRGTMGCGGPVINYVAIDHGGGVVSYFLHVR